MMSSLFLLFCLLLTFVPAQGKKCTGCARMRCATRACPTGSVIPAWGCTGECWEINGKCTGMVPQCACNNTCANSNSFCDKSIQMCLNEHGWNTTTGTCSTAQHRAVCAAKENCLTKQEIANCQTLRLLCPSLDCNPSVSGNCAAVPACIQAHPSHHSICAAVKNSVSCYKVNNCTVPSVVQRECEIYHKSCPSDICADPDSCFKYTNVTTCNEQKSCGWSNLYGYCQEMTTNCLSISSETSCEVHTGCVWDTSSNTCQSRRQCPAQKFGPSCNHVVRCNVQHGVCLRGTCSGQAGNGECSSCRFPYYGATCSAKSKCNLKNGYCSSVACYGTNGAGTCSGCKSGWTGPYCTIKTTFKCPKLKCKQIVNCFVQPCRFAKCPAYPDALCCDNYCGGCHANWYHAGHNVTTSCNRRAPLEELPQVQLQEEQVETADLEQLDINEA